MKAAANFHKNIRPHLKSYIKRYTPPLFIESHYSYVLNLSLTHITKPIIYRDGSRKLKIFSCQQNGKNPNCKECRCCYECISASGFPSFFAVFLVGVEKCPDSVRGYDVEYPPPQVFCVSKGSHYREQHIVRRHFYLIQQKTVCFSFLEEAVLFFDRLCFSRPHYLPS